MDIFAPTEALRLFSYHLAQEMFSPPAFETPLILETSRCEGSFCATATLHSKTVSQTALLADHHTDARTESVAAGKALFRLFSAFGGANVPYGTLVGVRPVKIAIFYLSRKVQEERLLELLERDYCMPSENARLLYALAQSELETENALSQNDAMLYVSIPFCPSRCRYCSFISQSAPKQLALLGDYLDRLNEELKETADLFARTHQRLRAVYLGGGTPGLLQAEELHTLFSLIHREFDLRENAELTAELGRPDTITLEKCLALKEVGVERICINPQTLSDEVLLQNGRCHTAEEFYKAFQMAREAKIESINTDLIAGLYSDTPDGFLRSLEEILRLTPENLTIHALCKKRASEESEKSRRTEDEPWARAMQNARESCIKRGYLPYYLYRQKNTIANLENLGYTLPGHACLYNIAMMQDLCHVFAVGAGAMTKLKKETKDGYQMIRLPAYKYPTEYLKDPEKGRSNRRKALLSME